jgi:hypothetical protein
LLLDILKEGLDSVILHLILHGTMAGCLIGSIAELVVLDMLDDCVSELLIDGFMDVDTLNVKADLARVHECQS